MADPDSVRDCSTGSPDHNPAPGASRGPVAPSYGRDFQHMLILQKFTKVYKSGPVTSTKVNYIENKNDTFFVMVPEDGF